MDLIDIYRRLPRIDCGECSERSCEEFAVKLFKSQRFVSECVKLADEVREELEKMLSDTESGGAGEE